MSKLRYADMTEDGQQLATAMANAYLDAVGWPPHLTKDEARRGLFSLIETGGAIFVWHQATDEFSLKLLR
jgi:hypothetical protein